MRRRRGSLVSVSCLLLVALLTTGAGFDTFARREKLVHAVHAINRLVESFDDSPKAVRCLEEWKKAEKEASDFILDAKKFPAHDPSRPGWQSPGADTAVRLGQDARKTFERLRPYLDRAVREVPRLTAKRARRLEKNLADAEKALEGEEGAAEKGQEDLPVPSAPALVALDIAGDDYAGAARRYRKLPAGPGRLLAFYVYSEGISARNDEQMKKVAPATRRGFTALSDYRLAMGRSPFTWDPSLARAAEGHSANMLRLGFFSHDSPVPGQETEEKRAAAAGYPGMVAETIYARPGIEHAIGVWMRSGAHHRTILSKTWIEAGANTTGPVTVNYGASHPAAPPVIVYP